MQCEQCPIRLLTSAWKSFWTLSWHLQDCGKDFIDSFLIHRFDRILWSRGKGLCLNHRRSASCKKYSHRSSRSLNLPLSCRRHRVDDLLLNLQSTHCTVLTSKLFRLEHMSLFVPPWVPWLFLLQLVRVAVRSPYQNQISVEASGNWECRLALSLNLLYWSQVLFSVRLRRRGHHFFIVLHSLKAFCRTCQSLLVHIQIQS